MKRLVADRGPWALLLAGATLAVMATACGGSQQAAPERLSVSQHEAEAERHEREMQARRITFETRIAEEAQQLTGDADRLEQALQNLVANALRYTPDEGRIELAAERRGDRTILTVRDSGPGVPVDQLDQIFDRFYKTDASRRSAGGSGLGLSIAKAIIGRHGGTILVRNDNGAVFEISLP